MRFLITCFFVLLITGACRAGVFDELKKVPVRERLARAQDIYNNQVRLKDSTIAIPAIRQLISLSTELDDKNLQCLSVSLLADQYARIRGINDYSTRLHLEAIALAEKFRLPLLIGICNYRLGRYYYNFKNYPVAFEYLLRADNHFYAIGYKEVPEIDEILYFIGSIYYETGNYDKAQAYLERVQNLAQVNNYVRKQSLNTLALIAKQEKDTTQALHYFQRTLDAAIGQHDSAWMGISYSNMGALYFFMQQFEKAYPLLEAGYRYCTDRKQWSDAYGDLLFLARIDLAEGRVKQAQSRIDSAIGLHRFYFTMSARKTLYETQALYYKKIGQPGKVLVVQQKLIAVKDSLAVSKDQQAYRKIQLQLETEKHLSDIDRIEAESHASSLKRNAVIAVLALSVIVLLLMYSRYRLMAKNTAAALLQRQHLLEAEKLRAEEKLKYARQLLQNFTENSRQKNELIEQFATELEQLKGTLPGHPVYEDRLRNFDKLVQSTILTNGEWEDFRTLFDKVHKGFFMRLEEKFPSLSLADTRLLALVKLGLSNIEMTRMMGMSAVVIEVAKQRLAQKINTATEELGIEYLVQVI